MARRRSEGASDSARDRRAAPGRHRHGATPPPAELSEDIDVVRAMYRALEAGDLESLPGLVDPNVRWVDPKVARLPFDGTRRGLPTVLQAAFRQGEDGTAPRLTAPTFVELGDGVLVAGRFFRGAEEEPFLHECSVRDGRVSLIRGYPAQVPRRR